MQSNYFHRACNKTVRKFYEDFDLLPKEAKELLWYSDGTPNFDDLKTAWELAGEQFNIDNLLKLNVFEEERKAKELTDHKAEKERKRLEKINRYYDNRNKRRRQSEYVDQYQWTLKDLGKKNRLIQKVSEEQAMKLLTERKNVADVKPAGKVWVREFVGTVKVENKKPEPEFMKFEPVQHICKMLHNAGGK